ncbi:MAG: beta-phosphoglucomutase [Bacillales bacterium]|jgi:beta-phosphoglucomutase|nr:beta-phosphoglucomutase [Bacillales bacterium]
MIKGIIFDLDGVLVFTDKYHYQAWQEMADREGVYFDEIINNKLRGVSRLASLDIILQKATKEYSQEEKIALANAKNKRYQELLKQLRFNDFPYKVRQLLKKLRRDGIKLAIGSSSRNASLILKQLQVIDLFDAISDGNNITHSKPDPEVFIKAAEMLDLDPTQCLVIEDAESGIEAANEGGFVSVGIHEAGNYSASQYRIKELSDIINIIKKLNLS